MIETPTLDRRQFLGTASGLTLGLFLPGRAAEAATTTPVNSWLTIGADDSIELVIGASDMGQGTFAGLAQILCEDLMVDPARVRLVQGRPSLLSPAPVGAAINTVGSGVTRGNFWKLRDAGAVAREMLVSAAMAAIGDSARANYSVTNGVILHVPSGATRSYGAVAAAAALLPVPSSAPLVPDSQFKCIGKTLARSDIPFKVDGSAIYGLDVRVPNMLYAVIRHCPTFGGTLASVPATPAGMVAVVPTKVIAGTGRGTELTGNVNAVAVVGTNTWDAWRASKRLSIAWTLPANASALNSAQFQADAQRLMTSATPYVSGGTNAPGTLYTVEKSTADANAAIAGATKVIDATYSLPYIAHACMEVLNCTVDYVAGQRCEVWAPTQSAKSALLLIKTITGLTEQQITVHVTYLGGGLGRKAELDFISQAVQVGMALQRPVKLMWPREEDFTHDQYRPMALVRARAGLDANNAVAGWIYRNVSPSILGQRGVPLGATGDSQGYEASQALPYRFGARLTEWVSHPSPIPVGFWRSVGASINTFAVESMIDELAAAAGQDPFRFRQARLTDPRWIAVLEAAANACRLGLATADGPGARHRDRHRLQHHRRAGRRGQQHRKRAARDAGLGRDRCLPDGESGLRRGPDRRRRRARDQRDAVRAPDLQQRRGASQELQQRPHDPARRDADRQRRHHALACGDRPCGRHRRRRRARRPDLRAGARECLVQAQRDSRADAALLPDRDDGRPVTRASRQRARGPRRAARRGRESRA